MLFPKTIAGKITRGEVTLAIRPATGRAPKPSDRRCVKATTKGEIQCHVIVLGVEELLAGEVTFKEARACGYRTTDHWRSEWVRWRDRAWVWRYEADVDELSELDLIARFDRLHAHKPVYAIRFKLAVDTPRFLARPTANSDDYTTQRHRAIDDLEVVDELTQKRYAEKAAKEGERQRAEFRRDLETERARRKAERGRSMRLPAYARRAA